ncbi:uncharacterized protein LAJ45_09509 [Morchella importuna]|uniref:Uncharacterized protein n=1 Tax=Morchella conica CCBAS932 TaxID=1392247 RepID=A0A3N4KM93_9PEZI|nr:uncharacterized protein H6S33_006618 [Morchella sextelata]XP_045967866.1 uncharacterized protein LAJ45_09509 [Morchella importuna]KAH0604241.1 hypothetical protein H6S33_006618 [Morchella sextelata]KAH8146562.1 hypothetical protein LAJ45_09509 [Morchella importuna]RPB11684.1 hypothetical protein P167DRAFT_536593 [Morchella conica CCBAS932]
MAYNTRSTTRATTTPTNTGRKAPRAPPKTPKKPVTATGRITKSSPTKKKTPTPATHHKRKPSIGDKLIGAAMKVEGTITGRPGVKAAGTKKMRGTDGKGSHRRTRSSR